MRVAFVGKGGSGKSTIAGTLARLAAREGEPVLALDVDTLPGLAFSVGLGPLPDEGLPEDLAERREGEGWVMKEAVTAEELVDRYAREAPDGVRFLQLGKLPGSVKPGSTTAFRHVVESFRRPGWSVVADLAAGTRQAAFGWTGPPALVGVVVEPTPASVATARRLSRVFAQRPGYRLGAVLNRMRGAAAPAGLGLPVWAEVPFDAEVAAAERAGLAPIDAAPRSRAVAAVAGLLDTLRALEEEAA